MNQEGSSTFRKPIQLAIKWACATSVVGLAAFLLTSSGCNSRGVAPPSWDPDGMADAAMDEFDANGDGSLEAGELKGSPGLDAAAKYMDMDGNGQLSRDEIQARIQAYVDSKTALMVRDFTVKYKGRPVVGAAVDLVPEPFLNGVVETASGVTDNAGRVQPTFPGAVRDSLRIGFYRVKITGGNPPVPAKYADGSLLGLEVSPLFDAEQLQAASEFKLED